MNESNVKSPNNENEEELNYIITDRENLGRTVIKTKKGQDFTITDIDLDKDNFNDLPIQSKSPMLSPLNNLKIRQIKDASCSPVCGSLNDS